MTIMQAAQYELLPENDLIQLGLIVLQSDVTIEDEFRAYFRNEKLSLLVNRIPFENEVTADTLQSMAGHLTRSASLFPVTKRFDAMGYACTSGAMQIGSEEIAQLIRSERTCTFVTNPMQAALSAFSYLGVKNVGYIGPYSETVCQTMMGHIEANGFNVSHAVTFNEEEDKFVGRISPETIRKTAIELAESAGDEIDVLFISCTNMKCESVLDDISRFAGLPALSSNKVLAWDLARSCGIAISL